MDRIKKTLYNNKEILIVDYSDLRGDSMFPIFAEVKRLILTDRKSYPILTVFNSNTHVSRSFVRQIEKVLPEVDEFVPRRAIIGISKTQMWILKGINLWYKRQAVPFDSMDKALEYLAKDESNGRG